MSHYLSGTEKLPVVAKRRPERGEMSEESGEDYSRFFVEDLKKKELSSETPFPHFI